MNRIWLATKLFFLVLLKREIAERARQLHESSATAAPPAVAPQSPAAAQKTPAAAVPAPTVPARSDALTLLEALQREARLIDFLQEEISSYTDDQVGGAVREVHQGCRAVLDRMFGIRPVRNEAEGTRVTVDEETPAAHTRLVGKVPEQRPVTGVLVHAGWKAERCQIPQWNGTPQTASVLAPAEVEAS